MNDDRSPDVTEPELWYALTELLRCQPDQAARTTLMTAVVRTAFSHEIEREKDPIFELQRTDPPVSEQAKKVIAELSPDPPFSLSRLQRRVALRNLEKELDHWPEARHFELLGELRKGLERRRNALGQAKPRDDAEADAWLRDAIQEGIKSPDSASTMDDIFAHVEKKLAFRELAQQILAQPDGEQVNVMRRAIASSAGGEPVDCALDAIERAEELPQADQSDRPRWGQITQVYDPTPGSDRYDVDVWDGALAWPVDVHSSVSGLQLGAIVWFRPRGEWAIVERIEAPRTADPDENL
jgi:hypothetical protein